VLRVVEASGEDESQLGRLFRRLTLCYGMDDAACKKDDADDQKNECADFCQPIRPEELARQRIDPSIEVFCLPVPSLPVVVVSHEDDAMCYEQTQRTYCRRDRGKEQPKATVQTRGYS